MLAVVHTLPRYVNIVLCLLRLRSTTCRDIALNLWLLIRDCSDNNNLEQMWGWTFLGIGKISTVVGSVRECGGNRGLKLLAI